jgi:hypothetical protein
VRQEPVILEATELLADGRHRNAKLRRQIPGTHDATTLEGDENRLACRAHRRVRRLDR